MFGECSSPMQEGVTLIAQALSASFECGAGSGMVAAVAVILLFLLLCGCVGKELWLLLFVAAPHRLGLSTLLTSTCRRGEGRRGRRS
jgi:hypothetical protein